MELVVEDFTQKKGRLGGMGNMVVWRSSAEGAKSGSAVISREPNLLKTLHYCLILCFLLAQIAQIVVIL